ncbi:MAG: transposase [Gammaproteobacteria bacterium]
MLRLKCPYHDGTTHIVMSPLEPMQRLAALVPSPRLHLIRFHGVLALMPSRVPRSFHPQGTKQATSLCLASRACRSTPIPPQPTTPRRSLPRRPPA